MAQIRWTVTAAEDLRAIENWIARDSPSYAMDFVNRLIATTEELSRFPCMGRVVPEFGRTHIREIIQAGYRLVYLCRQREVTILRVVHSARDMRRLVGLRSH